jgi:hypothetical protein
MVTDASNTRFSTVSVNGKTLGIGLKWEPITSGRDPKRAAREIGKDKGYLLVTLCKSASAGKGGLTDGGDGESQVSAGFVPRDQAPAKFKNMYCLGTLVGSVLGPHYIAAFDIGDGRFAIAMASNGLVIPVHGDRVCDADEARKTVNNFLSRFRTMGEAAQPTLVVPAEFNLGDDNRTLAELLPSKSFKRAYRLDPVSASFDPKVLLWGGLFGGLVIVGIGAYKRYQQDQERARELAAAKASQNEQTLAAVEKKQAVPRPWISQPSAQAMLDAQAGVLKDTPLSMCGWVLVDVRLEMTQVTARYKQVDGAPIGCFVEAVRSHTGGNLPNLQESGTQGAVTAAIQLSAEDGDDLQQTPILQFALQNYLQQVAIGELAVQATTRPPEDNPPPTWSSTPFTISGVKLQPEKLLEGMDLAGLRITTITTTLNAESAELDWTIEGNIYGR